MKIDHTVDHYAALEIKNTANLDEIKKAYLRLAKLYHPDLNKGSESITKCKAINEAFSVLSDALKRSQYDTLRQTPRPTVSPAQKSKQDK